MNSKRSLRSFSNTFTAAGLALAVSACSTVYQDEWDQVSDVPDLDQSDQRSQALLDYCKKLHSRGDLNLAAGICNRAHEINPTDPAPLIELARVLEGLEMKASAEEAYRAALLLDPQQTDALYGLGKIYIDQQRYDAAVEPLQAAAASNTDDPRIYNALGVIMDQQGQHVEAQSYYHQGLDNAPRNVSLRNNLGLSMVLNGDPEAGLAMLRDVAAEPAAGETAGRNLEMASQIAAQRILEGEGDKADAQEGADAWPQTGEIEQPEATGEPVSVQDLSTLAPSSSVDASKAPASEPMPLLESQPQEHSEAAPTTPTTPTAPVAASPAPSQDLPESTRSLDHELADAWVTQQAEATDLNGERAEERPFDPAVPEQVTALPATGSTSEPTSEPAVDFEADAAAIPATDVEADAESDPSSHVGSGIPRDWSLAAQTVFATSKVAIPEPSQITPQERSAANDAFHATAKPEALTQTAAETAGEPATKVLANPHGELDLVLASTTDAQAEAAAAADSYPIDEDTFYTAQLASFLSVARARAGWQILQADAGELLARSDGYIVRADLGAELGTYYRVRTGMMNDRAAASQFCSDLRAEGLDCMPVEASMQEINETLVEKICQSDAPGVFCRTVQRSEAAPETTPNSWPGGAPHDKG